MLKNLYIVILSVLVLVSCSDEQKEKELLTSAGELEVAWHKLDHQAVAALDTARIQLTRLHKDSLTYKTLSDVLHFVLPFSDSLNKIYLGNISQLEASALAHESKLINIKTNISNYLSWKLLVNQGDVEMATAKTDLSKFRNLYDSVSVEIKSTAKQCANKWYELNAFIESQRNKIPKDSLQTQ